MEAVIKRKKVEKAYHDWSTVKNWYVSLLGAPVRGRSIGGYVGYVPHYSFPSLTKAVLSIRTEAF